MAKQIIAVTGIKHNGTFFPAGEPVDPAGFTKAELTELHDNGAIVVEDNTKPEDVKPEDVKATETPKVEEAPKVEASVPKDTAVKK